MAYGIKALSPIEIGLSLSRHIQFSKTANDKLMRYKLNLLEERSYNS